MERGGRDIGEVAQHAEGLSPCRVAPVAKRLRRPLRRLGIGLGEHDGDGCVPGAGAVDPADALNHRIEGGEVHHRVGGVEVDADLAGRGHHQIHRRRRIAAVAPGPKVRPHGAACERGPLACAQRPREQRHAPGAVRTELAVEPRCDARRIGDALDEHGDGAGAVGARGVANLRNPVARRARAHEAHALARVQPAPDRCALVIGGGEPHHRPGRETGGGEPQGAQARTVVESGHRAEQRVHRRRQVGLVEHHDRIVREQPRVHRALRPPVAVACEQQPRADHVHGADDHRGVCRVEAPGAIVGEPAAQHPEPDGALGRKGRARVECARKRGQRRDTLDPATDGVGGLSHDRAAVDDVDDARGQASVVEPSEQQEEHARGLAEAGGDINGVGDVGVEQRRVEPALPRVGVVSDDVAKVRNIGDVAWRRVPPSLLPCP